MRDEFLYDGKRKEESGKQKIGEWGKIEKCTEIGRTGRKRRRIF